MAWLPGVARVTAGLNVPRVHNGAQASAITITSEMPWVNDGANSVFGGTAYVIGTGVLFNATNPLQSTNYGSGSSLGTFTFSISYSGLVDTEITTATAPTPTPYGASTMGDLLIEYVNHDSGFYGANSAFAVNGLIPYTSTATPTTDQSVSWARADPTSANRRIATKTGAETFTGSITRLATVNTASTAYASLAFTWTLERNGAAVTSGSGTTDAAGNFTVSPSITWLADSAYTLRVAGSAATYGGHLPAVFSVLVTAAGVPTFLLPLTPAQTVLKNTAVTVRNRLLDQFGQVMVGAGVRHTRVVGAVPESSGLTNTGDQVTTDAAGDAAYTFTPTVSGAEVVTAFSANRTVTLPPDVGIRGAVTRSLVTVTDQPPALGLGVPVVFNATGADQTYVVPAGVNTIYAYLRGGGGGGPGGRGAIVRAVVPVTPGETLTIRAGGIGTKATGSTAGGGGYPGGGGGGGATSITGRGWGGGGYSAILRGTTVLALAGGGGGSSVGVTGPDDTNFAQSGSPGHAGHPQGTPGSHSTFTNLPNPPLGGVVLWIQSGGGGGTQTAGGAGGVLVNSSGSGYVVYPGAAGTTLAGGNGGTTPAAAPAGGGGGGGWFGGGGGAGVTHRAPSAGGGGSSYVAPTTTLLSAEVHPIAEDGQVIINLAGSPVNPSDIQASTVLFLPPAHAIAVP